MGGDDIFFDLFDVVGTGLFVELILAQKK